MFSYRHGFHAGNHADVLKHLVLLATVRHLLQKAPPVLFVDTHAGAGIYRLDSEQTARSGEAAEGIQPLWDRLREVADPSPAEALRDYLALIQAFNAGERLRVYPGSPLILHHLMRPGHDRLRLFELHPSDSRALTGHVAQLKAGRSVSMARQDGFEGLKGLLPPPPTAGGSRRALVLMDPSYELKSDYGRVFTAMQDALRRFPTGVYLVWYPVIPRPEAHDLPRKLKTLAQQSRRPWLHAVLGIGQAADTGPDERPGLLTSGVFVINAPHTLEAAVRPALDQALALIGRGRGQRAVVETG